VHDDIEDGDTERRHRPTLWAIWGIPLAINAGDALIALSRLAIYPLVERFGEGRILRLMRIYDETCLELCEGQYLDIAFEQQPHVGVEAYLDMISKKTASLIRAGVQCGAMLATDDPTVIDAYRRFGHALGMAFQVADDVKGSFWRSAESGKAEAGDIRRRKKTLPVVWALENAGEEDRSRLHAIYSAGIRATDGSRPHSAPPAALSDADVDEVLEVLERSGARAHAMAESRRYRDAALARLAEPPRAGGAASGPR
jgi:geranylgeranyl diphosphate synthase, type I